MIKSRGDWKKVERCSIAGCREPLRIHHWFCDRHWAKRKRVKDGMGVYHGRNK